METTIKTCSGVPYQYKVNTKKRVTTAREGLTSDEKEVEDLLDVEKIEEILHGYKASPLSISVSVWNP
jgi:hypothetical protein